MDAHNAATALAEATHHLKQTNQDQEAAKLDRKPQPDAGQPATAPVWFAATRAVALFFGLFALLNVAGSLTHSGFDANIWWIDLRPVSSAMTQSLLVFAALLLILFAVAPNIRGLLRFLARVTALFILCVAVWNTSKFYTLVNSGEITAGIRVPFSLFVAGCFLLIHIGLLVKPPVATRPMRDGIIGLLTFAVCLVALPLAQMFCFGKTDYRRKADAIVVFGCRAYADGRPSAALADRVRTGCQLVQAGLANKLIFSGGPGDGDIHETEAMRRMAVQLGVPEDYIVLDARGVNTQATVDNTVPLFEKLRVERVLAVSHFYHLPRIKLCYRRNDWEVFTVPAHEQQQLSNMDYLLGREVAALWGYYLRPLFKDLTDRDILHSAGSDSNPKRKF